MRKNSLLFLTLILLSMMMVSAEPCDPQISLLNQDPYPAVPGEYVKLVFQVEDLDNPDCGDFTFELVNNYPIIFDPTEMPERFFKKVDYITDYSSALLIPYEVRIDENAVDGSNTIEVISQAKGKARLSNSFTIEVEDSKATFEVHVKNYDYTTHELTLEVLNVGTTDIKALVVEVPQQDNAQIKGSNRIIVGDLDSNEYTTADFEALPSDGPLYVNLIYTDSINVRRTEAEKLTFDSTYFMGRVNDIKETNKGMYVLSAIIILVIIWFIIKKLRKKKKTFN